MFRRQPPQSAVEFVARLLPLDPFRGKRGRGVCHLLQWIVSRRVRLRMHLAPALAAAQGVDGAVVRDPVEPRLQRGAPVELVHRLPGPQEGLHRHVFGIVRADQPRGHGVHSRPQRLEGAGEGLGIAVLRAG